MSRSLLIPFITISLLLLTLAAVGEETTTTDLQGRVGSGASLGKLPLTFVENAGQWDTPARFVARRGGLVARFEKDAMILQLESRDAEDEARGVSVRLAFEGALETATVEGAGQESGFQNFFLGNDPAKWHSRVPAYRQILYRSLYPGIDVRVREASRRLEYDVLLAPGADLEQLVIRCEGSEGLAVEPDGTLVIETALGPIRQEPPTTWDELASGERVPVECRYCLVDGTRFGFEVMDRDPSMALVIDPGLEWSTFVGGVDLDGVWDVAVDASSGDVIATGETSSPGFPTTPGVFDVTHNGVEDVFVLRMAADGSSLTWSTFLGADGVDVAHTMVLGSSGEVTVAGRTTSALFPTTPGADDTSHNGAHDAFVTRLDRNGGSLIYSTFLGGDDYDWVADLALDDPSGEVVLAGYTESPGFPTTPGAFSTSLGGIRDAFVTRLNADGSDLVFSTFLGSPGEEGPNLDTGAHQIPIMLGVDLTPSGAPTVFGRTTSFSFPTTPGAYDTSFNGAHDMFVTQLDAAGSALIYSTYLGASGSDHPFALDLDEFGNATVCGQTYSSGFPTTPGAFDTSFNSPPNVSDGFVARLDATGSSLLYSTFLGGSGLDFLIDLDLYDSGDVVVTGASASSTFPTTWACFDPSHNGDFDVVLSRLSMAGLDSLDLVYSTFVGGADFDEGLTVAVRGEEVTLAGSTFSLDFPVTPGCFQTVVGGFVDGHITRFDELTVGVQDSPPVAALEPRVRLGAPLPNPAHGRVFYDVDLSHGTRVQVGVFDIQGRLVRSLIDEEFAAGSHHLAWDPGSGLPAGAYYLRLTADGAPETRKIFLVR